MDENMVTVCLGNTRQMESFSSVSKGIHIRMFSFLRLIKQIALLNLVMLYMSLTNCFNMLLVFLSPLFHSKHCTYLFCYYLKSLSCLLLNNCFSSEKYYFILIPKLSCFAMPVQIQKM